ncbi:cytoplasmic dynein 1 light intermediate chain 2-like protein [Dinothrombium tinctorium]|uniref:Dynein light intermediate chain n=1 Tax=Dinothrombium tinctorium TaxID=1965070 RepID=A0A443R2U5_9ACAR|nr:cytoplasmic dynein 1 light intermediate chain 2-like protein [Dinothrombium tinctorium]RWS09577.1 cytoplasmic dynein 1 light intermediate chain 2-like protein [Dinothrombium tinctorium]
MNNGECSEEEHVWLTILQQVQSCSSNKLPSNKALLVIGENETGKTSLIAKIQGNDDPKKGSGLEYHHLLVRDEYRDEQTRLGVWVLDGDLYHQNLLKFALNEASFPNTTVLLIASMTNPWDILDSLEKWANILEEHIERLKMKPEKLNHFKQLVMKRYLDYISPGDEIEGLVTSPVKSRSESISDNLVESSNSTHTNCNADTLGENVLTHNLGLDIVVVITKTDYMSTLEKEYDYKEEAFDFIQQAVRKFCLKYGASLFYVSAKVNKNCDLLYKYLVHRIYGLPFKTPALVVEKDAVFIPAGWDSEKKIAILYENIQSCSPDDNYNDIIAKPVSKRPLQKDIEITSEDDQVFLLKMQAQLNQNVPSVGVTNQTPTIRTSPAIQKPLDRRSMGTSPVSGVPIDGPKNSPAGEGVLQNFFNSLLNRKSGAGSGGSPRHGSERDTRSIAEELHRMTGGTGIATTGTPTANANNK